MNHPALRGAKIVGLGMYVPERALTNFDLEKMVDTNDAWIVERTGIRERRIVASHEATSDLATAAARQALETSGVSAEALDLVIVATCTGDHNSLPATATLVQENIGARRAAAFDVAAACSGFVYGLDIAHQFLATGRFKNILVAGAETMSRVVNWKDRNTCVLFGDGGGAAVLQPGEPGEGILGTVLGSDGGGVCLLNAPAGGTRLPLTPQLMEEGQQFVMMRGREVYRFAIEIMGEASLQALRAVGMTPADVDLFVPHQANIRIIEAAAQRMELPAEKVFVNVERYGNTSAASIPIALFEAWRAGRLQPGNVVVTVGFGAGLTWGANVLRWTLPAPVGSAS